ncbi:MAG: hypothetical protein JWN69_1892 [Alphaproteobacteria bacterium]|nr:hypothetical protein [Alphaproteobacteria bacterium]
MESDQELFAHWAAEELIAAGRAEEQEQRATHRRRAEMLVDIFRALRAPRANDLRSGHRPGIGGLLAQAFTPERDPNRSRGPGSR